MLCQLNQGKLNVMNTNKILLPSFVVISFILYGLAMRNQSAPKVFIATKPNSGTSINTQTNNSSGTTVAPATTNSTTYKDGTYTGDVADAYYGNVQVSATIKNGSISSVQFLQYPNSHQTSVMINSQAMPLLQQEAIQAQSAQIDGVSGATYTAQAFTQSLSSALSQAKP
jgi:uncharacterized protein with FMN-binding domain